MICPNCEAENIDGADECEECLAPLEYLSIRQPNSRVEERLCRDRLRVLRPRTPLVVSPQEPVGAVLRLLVERKTGCVLVVQDLELVGIFTERDALIRINVDIERLRDRPISEFMTPSPARLNIGDKLVFALHRMDAGGYRHLPIFEDGELVGIISVRDVLRYITENLVSAGTSSAG